MQHRQVREVPAALYRRLKAKAAREGASFTLAELEVLAELEKVAARPTPRELRERLRQREAVHLNPSAAEMIRESRGRAS